MNDRQENFYSMCKTVLQTCNAKSDSWSGCQPFVFRFEEFKALLSELNSLRLIQETDITGYAKDKQAKRDRLVYFLKSISSGIFSYAKTIGDVPLKEKVSVPFRFLVRVRGTVLVSKARQIHELASLNLLQLEPYFITQERIDVLQQAINDFSDTLSSPAVKSDIREAAFDRIPVIINMLRDKFSIMDNIVFMIKLQDENFYEIYMKSREIYDLGKRNTSNSQSDD